MTKKYDGLDEAFNVETEIVSAEKESMEVAKKLKLEKNDVDKDYFLFEFSNEELYDVLLKQDE